MTTYARGARVVTGAIVSFDRGNPIAGVIVFQYNPESISRSLSPRSSEADGARSEVLRLSGPPVENISVTVELDAADGMEAGDPVTETVGIYPQLSALEMLIYPKLTTVIRNLTALNLGRREIVPAAAPLTLFVWGIQRVVPVRIDGMQVEELRYDDKLNPILASVSLDMRVLSYSDFESRSVGTGIFLAHQAIKETLATVGSVQGIAAIATGQVRLDPFG